MLRCFIFPLISLAAKEHRLSHGIISSVQFKEEEDSGIKVALKCGREERFLDVVTSFRVLA